MSGSPQQQPEHEYARDEVADQRRRHQVARAGADPPDATALSDPEREHYELQLDEYEVLLAGYRAQMATYAAQLDAAHHDGLTGTWLRAAGHDILGRELQRAVRTDTSLSVAFVDVDGLKACNDTAGHAAGDTALRAVARALMQGLRAYDSVIRWGGDEFLCVLPGASQAEATVRLEQARKLMADDPQALGISVGIVERQVGESVDSLVGRADRELYGTRRHRGRS